MHAFSRAPNVQHLPGFLPGNPNFHVFPRQHLSMMIWGFPKIRDMFLEGPHNEDYSILGSIFFCPLILGNYSKP